MKICIAAPVGRNSSSGNFQTAKRWKRILQNLGHKVIVTRNYSEKSIDFLVVIHAWRSAQLILEYHKKHPKIPLLLCLAGTDIYRFQKSHPEETDLSMKIADKLVCLHDLVHRSIPQGYHNKLCLIRQSAIQLKRQPPLTRFFEVLLVGHLREEKDPFCGAKAIRNLPIEYRTNIIHIGKAITSDFHEEALEEMNINSRYQWLGELPRWKLRKRMTRARALLITSTMEGGANVVSEAIMSGLPVIASKIDGNIGLLGVEYKGYFPVGDVETLKKLLMKIEDDPFFLKQLEEQVLSLQKKYREEVEQKRWEKLLKEVLMT